MHRTDIIVEIADSGSGIPNDLLDDIFIPFVTTKKEGTGLGLSITKKIMAAHGGSVHVIENSDKGVTFRITLPVKPIYQGNGQAAMHSTVDHAGGPASV